MLLISTEMLTVSLSGKKQGSSLVSHALNVNHIDS